MTGYSGRVGIYEVLMNSPEIRKQIKPLTDIPKLREQGSARACGRCAFPAR
jgi:general secretion pathway protein E